MNIKNMSNNITTYLHRVVRCPSALYEATKHLPNDALLFLIRDEIQNLYPNLQFSIIDDTETDIPIKLFHCIITNGLPAENVYHPDIVSKFLHGEINVLDNLSDLEDSYDFSLYSEETQLMLNTIQLVFEQYNNYPENELFTSNRFHATVELDAGYEQQIRRDLLAHGKIASNA